MTDRSTPLLRRQLREAAAEELDRILEEHSGELDAAAVRHLFRNPFLGATRIERLFELPGIEALYEARREAVRHPSSPRTLVLRYLPGLYWVDLTRVGLDTRLHPVVRRAADLRLIERLPGLAVGERVAVARSASSAVLAALRHDPSPSVVSALLDNPRTTEALLMPLVASERANPLALAAVAKCAKWASRPALRAGLCRNPALPLPSALALLPGLSKRDLLAVEADPRLAASLRRKAGVLGTSSTGRF